VIQDTINAGGQLTVGNQLGGSTAMTQALGLTNLSSTSGGLQYSFNSSYAPAAGDYLQLSNGTNNWVFEFQTTGSTPSAAPSGYTLGANAGGGTNYLTNVIMGTSTSPMAAVGALINSLQQSGFAASLSNNGNLTIAGNNVSSTGSAWEKASTAYSSGSSTNEAGVTQTALSGGSAAITIVQNAIGTMNGIAAKIGATQQEVTGMMNFSSSLSTSLTTGSGALIDANMASESAQLNSLQTKQQLAIRTLSIANAQPQVLLNLFQ
jgi:flagellin